jgi:hypothetical protein
MRILGVDFTSSASGDKVNHLVECELDGGVLRCASASRLGRAGQLEGLLRAGGEWVLGLDFPFGLPEQFVAGQQWPAAWHEYARHASRLDYGSFRATIEAFRASRPDGDKQPRRVVDRLAKSQSPLTTVRTPVANMFHVGVRYLLDAPCDVVPFRMTGAARVVVEAYPALVARQLVAGNRYKDGEPSQTREVRDTMLRRLERGDLSRSYGLDVTMAPALREQALEDDMGDVIDSLLCAMQAAWAYTKRHAGWGAPAGVTAEGWIVDPCLADASDGVMFPPPGAFNSSRTRVRPVFGDLLRRDPTGRRWLPSLLRLAPRNTALAQALAQGGTALDGACLASREVQVPGDAPEVLPGCFERAFPPPAALLRWCLEEPARLARPLRRGDQETKPLGRRNRAALLGPAGPGRDAAQQAGLSELQRLGSTGSRRAWWAFEGFTSVDCALETGELLLLIEGKRFEPVSSAGSWIPDRNQISRNLEVASDYAAQAVKQFAVLLIGPDNCQAPDDETLVKGWPHLDVAAQNRLLDHFLGAVSWRQVCSAVDVDYDSLPVTSADARAEATRAT